MHDVLKMHTNTLSQSYKTFQYVCKLQKMIAFYYLVLFPSIMFRTKTVEYIYGWPLEWKDYWLKIQVKEKCMSDVD